MTEIIIDGDACPVKEEALRVAERHGLTLRLVSNRWLRFVDHPLVQRVVVPDGLDKADDWIAEHCGPGDVVITADVPLAARCVAQKARVLGPTGKEFTEAGIGMTVAMRDLMTHLRDTGEVKSYNAAFGPKDRSRFLSALENLIQAVKRGA
jgi:uncharacterized protein YaiI (UPF0178 family)